MDKRNNIIERADTYFSKIVRYKTAFFIDDIAYNKCYTCGKIAPVKQLQAGHFMSRRYIKTRFDKRNVKPQCKNCNMPPSRYYPYGKSGNLGEYSIALINEYGADILNELKFLAKSNSKLMTYELKEMLNEFKKEVKELKT